MNAEWKHDHYFHQHLIFYFNDNIIAILFTSVANYSFLNFRLISNISIVIKIAFVRIRRVPPNGQTKIVCVDKRVEIAGDCIKLTNRRKIFMGCWYQMVF